MAALSRLIASGQYATQFYGPILLSVARNGTNRVANFASEKALPAAVATKDYIAENAVPGADATKGFLDKVMSPLIVYVSNQLVYIAIGLGCVVLGYFVGIPLLGAIAVVFLRSVGFASSGVVKGSIAAGIQATRIGGYIVKGSWFAVCQSVTATSVLLRFLGL